MIRIRKNIQVAKKLRRNMTDAERLFWYNINYNQLGVKFRRQQPIGPYVVDFVCHSIKLVIELDGNQHLQNVEYDNRRTKFIESCGYKLIRIPNVYMSRDVLPDVIHTLYRCINENLDFNEFFVSKYN
ncbi:MAG: DUF559 domain-containing protein [Alphaproteobacteria bacterium]|nr:DUF559 domain-containing protein [Alphaproteobacteria bacterium]